MAERLAAEAVTQERGQEARMSPFAEFTGFSRDIAKRRVMLRAQGWQKTPPFLHQIVTTIHHGRWSPSWS